MSTRWGQRYGGPRIGPFAAGVAPEDVALADCGFPSKGHGPSFDALHPGRYLRIQQQFYSDRLDHGASLIGGQYESESAEACQRGGQDQRPELAMIGLRRLSDQPPEHRHDGLLEPVLRTVIDWVTLGQVVNPDRWFVAYSLRQRRVGKGALCAVPGRTRWLCPPAPIASARSDDIGASLRVLWNHQKPSDATPKLAAYCVRCGAESVAGPARGGGVAVDGRA